MPAKRPRDPNQLAKFIVDVATGERSDQPDTLTDAQRFARTGGLKGGPARRDALSADRRSEIARKAAKARWEPSDT